MASEFENQQPDRITYSESRTINVGNYESVQVFLSYGANIKSINRVDNTATISHSDSLEFEKENFKAAVGTVTSRVRAVLDHRERTIRKLTEDYVDFDTRAKAPKKKA